MRRAFLGACLLAMAGFCQAQSNIYEVNGNVGIGTATPAAKLDVNGPAIVGGDLLTGSLLGSIRQGPDIGGALMLENASKTANGAAKRWTIYNMSGSYGNSLQFWAYDNLGCQNGGLCASRFTIMDNGKVGIGTVSPAASLHIGVREITELTTEVSIDRIAIQPPHHTGGPWFINVRDKDSKAYLDLRYGTNKIYTVDHTGNMGIGTNNPDEKLTVNGKVHAAEIKVNNSIWPDYVFRPSYKLMPLSKVESFIKTNGHLPEVPSAKEVEEKGIEVGANQALLLKKIEELTLYMIELKKENEGLKKEMADFKKAVQKNSKL